MSEDTTDDKMVPVLIRVPKSLLEAFDKTCPPNGRAEVTRELWRERVAKASGQAPSVSLSKLKVQANKHRQEMERLQKNVRIDFVFSLFLKAGQELEVEHIPLIIQDLYKYKVQPSDQFNRYDLEDCIEYLEERLKLENVLKQINAHRAIKYGIAEPTKQFKKRYIPIADLCPSTCDTYETKEEHDIRVQKEREEEEAEALKKAEEAEEEREAAEGSDAEEENEEFEEQW